MVPLLRTALLLYVMGGMQSKSLSTSSHGSLAALLSGKKPFACFSNRRGNGLLLFLRSLPVVLLTRFAKRSLTSLFAHGGAKQGSGPTGLTSTLCMVPPSIRRLLLSVCAFPFRPPRSEPSPLTCASSACTLLLGTSAVSWSALVLRISAFCRRSFTSISDVLAGLA